MNNINDINKTGIFDDCPKLKNIPNEEISPPKNIEKKQITIIFTSTNQIILNYKITCFNTDIFETLRDKIFNVYPSFKNKEIIFTAQGNIINERVSLAENKIENDTVILINDL